MQVVSVPISEGVCNLIHSRYTWHTDSSSLLQWQAAFLHCYMEPDNVHYVITCNGTCCGQCAAIKCRGTCMKWCTVITQMEMCIEQCCLLHGVGGVLNVVLCHYMKRDMYQMVLCHYTHVDIHRLECSITAQSGTCIEQCSVLLHVVKHVSYGALLLHIDVCPSMCCVEQVSNLHCHYAEWGSMKQCPVSSNAMHYTALSWHAIAG